MSHNTTKATKHQNHHLPLENYKRRKAKENAFLKRKFDIIIFINIIMDMEAGGWRLELYKR